MVRQSAGLILRVQRVAETADKLAAINSALAARGIRLLVASPPNSATIYEDQLPTWARDRGRRRNTTPSLTISPPEAFPPWTCGLLCARPERKETSIIFMTRIGRRVARSPASTSSLRPLPS